MELKNLKEPKLITPLSYEDISADTKKAVVDIIEILKDRTNQGISIDLVCEELLQKFKIEEIPMMDEKSTLWYDLTKDEKIGKSYQGYKIISKDGKKIKIPHIAFSGDLDMLEDFAIRLLRKLKDIQKV
jgi:hypothetical protein